MVAFSFTILLEKILSGEKHHTIRRYNERRIEQTLRLGMQIYWKQRVRGQSRYLFDTKLNEVQILTFNEKWWPSVVGRILRNPAGALHVKERWPSWRRMTRAEANDLARKDGFESIQALQAQLRLMYKDAHQGDWAAHDFYPPGKVAR